MTGERARLLRWLVRAGVSFGLIVVVLFQMNLERVVDGLAGLYVGWFLLAMLIKGVGISAGILRWRLLLYGQDLHLPLANLAGAYLVGLFFGSFLPSTIGLDAYRTYYAAVRTRAVARTVSVTVVEKVVGLLALSLLALAALPLGVRLLPPRALWLLGAVICAPILVTGLLVVRPDLFVRLAEALRSRKSEKRWSEGIARVSDALARFGWQRRRLLVALLLGWLVHGATSAMYLATARAVGATVPAAELLFVGPLMITITLIPISIAGIGVRESIYVFFLSGVGVLNEHAALLAFLGFLAGEIYGLAGGAVWALTRAARPEEGHGLIEVVRRAAAWVRGGKAEETVR